MPRVMISYRQVDGQREFALRLEQVLASAGIETWLDVLHIQPGFEWEEAIFEGIINSDYVILCLSPEYFESEYCLFECYIARGYGKKLLPVVAPHTQSVSILDLISTREETKGLDHLNIIGFDSNLWLGLPEDEEKLMKRLIQAILDPRPLNINYDVYFSYRWRQAVFATRIADDLNQAGILTFIHTRQGDAGADWRQVSWNAALRAKMHIVILSPDVRESQHIKNEVLIMRTRVKKGLRFIPILAEDFAYDKAAIDAIRQSFADSTNLSVLSRIQWYIPNEGYTLFIDRLIKDIRVWLSDLS